jgi:hypothetical protein
LDKYSRLASRVRSARSIAEIVVRVRSTERLRSAREIGELLRQ